MGLCGFIIVRLICEEVIKVVYFLISNGNKEWIEEVFVKNFDF